MAGLRLLLVDDQGLFLEGLRHLLAAHDHQVLGTAGDGLEALAKARSLHPDAILMDVAMPRCDGLEATKLILAEMPDIKIVMLTVSEDDDVLFEAVRSGAYGYLLKQSDATEFLDQLSRLSYGEPPFSRGLSGRILREFARRAPGPGQEVWMWAEEPAELTLRQRSVLAMAAQGMRYREIAAVLCLTEHAIKYHVRQILERLHLENRAQMIAYAQRTGLLRQASAPLESLVPPTDR